MPARSRRWCAWCGPHVGDHHHRRGGASGILRLASRRSPTPRRKSSSGWSRAASPSSIATIAYFARLQPARRARPASRSIVAFGDDAEADARLLDCALQRRLLDRRGRHSRPRPITYKIGVPGRHLGMNSLAVLGGGEPAWRGSGARGTGARAACAAGGPRGPAHARIARRPAPADRRKLQRQSDLDARRARRCSAGADSAAAAAASRCSATCWNSGRPAPSCTAASPMPSGENGIDLVFCCRSADGRAVAGASGHGRGGYADTAAALEPQRGGGAARPATPVMVKGSAG